MTVISSSFERDTAGMIPQAQASLGNCGSPGLEADLALSIGDDPDLAAAAAAATDYDPFGPQGDGDG